MNLYSIRDRLAHEFAPPFSAVNDEVAGRMTRNTFRGLPENTLNDFELFQVGTFDETNGYIDRLSIPKPIALVAINKETKNAEAL